MKNAQYNTMDVRKRCENKLDIDFGSGSEQNGWFSLNNKKVARITVPYGRKSIPPKTYKSMANQLKLSVEDFDKLLDCPLKKEGYIKIIKAKIPELNT